MRLPFCARPLHARSLHAWPLSALLLASALLACHSRNNQENREGTNREPANGDEAGRASAVHGSAVQGTAAQQRSAAQQSAQSTTAEPIVHVPVGKFRAGSRPLDPGRDPSLEGATYEVTLGPFRMDRLPYPGGSAPPKTGVSVDEARALCAERGGRLCTELEWERACKGPSSARYASGDEPCPGPVCQSGYDVLGLGQRPEWTGSVFGTDSHHRGEPVLRGGPLAGPAAERRCARRSHENAGEPRESIGFRCCYGAPNAERAKEPTSGAPFREVELPVEELRTLLLADEHTRELATELQYWKDDAAATVLARGPGQTMGFSLTTRAVEWSPALGVTLLVASGRSAARTAFVVAYFMAGTERVLAGSFVMKNEPGPIALAYAESIRPRMHFSSCWGCPGETGKLLFRPPESVVLLQP